MGHVHRATAWREVLEDPIRGRDGKPRTSGLTMVIDKGLGLAQTRDLLELASDYIDLLKISFGTSALYPETLLREKISLIKAFNVDVCPGGTLLEIALWQRRLEPFLDRAADLGFNYIEVSDGTVPLTRDLRRKAILQSLAAGFTVVTEVGKKDPSDSMPPGFLCRQAEEDLAAGASAVVVEARESGTGVGIYREDGSVKEGELAEMVARIGDLRYIVWEAPLKAQQVHLLRAFGPQVNLGNVPPSDVIALEATRRGLRGDTLRLAVKASLQREEERAASDAAALPALVLRINPPAAG